MESQNGVPHDPEIMDFDTELVTVSPSSRPPCNLAATVSATVSKMLFIYPRLLGRIEVPRVAPTTNTTTTHHSHNTPVTPRTSGSADSDSARVHRSRYEHPRVVACRRWAARLLTE